MCESFHFNQEYACIMENMNYLIDLCYRYQDRQL